ncbi:MAG: substrate-binding domain-containing protein [bacterium]|nr:MAG: substrate-binding domain-containing protein [bacterium]
MRLLKVMVIASVLGALTTQVSAAGKSLKLSSSTSIEDTGLLDHLIPAFEERTGIEVQLVAVGAAQAMKLAEDGAVDVTVLHAPTAEKAFLDAGHGVNRRTFMVNYYVVIGPPDDPAGVLAVQSSQDAFKAIAASSYPFVSRGDGSGTHEREQEIWKAATGAAPRTKPWYMETEKGMLQTLDIADRKGAYTLSDSATFQMAEGRLQAKILFRKRSQALYNPYSVIAVNPATHADVHYMEAMQFIAFVTSPEGQRMIGDFRDGSGNRLFVPLTRVD